MIDLPRPLQEHLLGRSIRDVLTRSDRTALSGQRVLITGGGGSLGSELARQLADCGPARVTIVEQCEYALFRVERRLRAAFPEVAFDFVLGDVTRPEDILPVCRATRPHVVYHAAAYKHVALTETAVIPAARTNVLGTLQTVEAARSVGARLVLISSDKAAQPRSVMGATKRMAELVTLGQAGPAFRPLAVRFGNILGSAGSLVEIMWRCVEEGRNLPITDPEATRFFMTAGEAVSLVLKADLTGRRAEVFWLDMGEPLRVGTLADRFIQWARRSGRPGPGIDIIGLRPGEKVREELTSQGLEMRQTRHPRIWSALQPTADPALVARSIRDLRRAIVRGDAAAALAAIQLSVTDFHASGAASTASVLQGRPARRRLAATA